MILTEFDIRNPYFDSHYYIILPFLDILDHFLTVLTVSKPFWIKDNIKIDENHCKSKFPMILIKFDIRNPIFEPHYHMYLTIFDHFRSFQTVLDRFWTVLGHEEYENR